MNAACAPSVEPGEAPEHCVLPGHLMDLASEEKPSGADRHNLKLGGAIPEAKEKGNRIHTIYTAIIIAIMGLGFRV